jgi:hypothetical protein
MAVSLEAKHRGLFTGISVQLYRKHQQQIQQQIHKVNKTTKQNKFNTSSTIMAACVISKKNIFIQQQKE